MSNVTSAGTGPLERATSATAASAAGRISSSHAAVVPPADSMFSSTTLPSSRPLAWFATKAGPDTPLSASRRALDMRSASPGGGATPAWARGGEGGGGAVVVRTFCPERCATLMANSLDGATDGAIQTTLKTTGQFCALPKCIPYWTPVPRGGNSEKISEVTFSSFVLFATPPNMMI